MATEQSIVMGIALAYLFVRALEESNRKNEREEAEEDRRLDALDDRRGQPRSDAREEVQADVVEHFCASMLSCVSSPVTISTPMTMRIAPPAATITA